MRIRLDLAYDGTDFHGWAAQPRLRTVQGELEAALATALRVAEVPVVCAGRTDTGVHARGQVAHLDVAETDLAASAGRSQDPPTEALVRRLNGILPADVRVRRAVVAAEGFDARFSALWRRYAYRAYPDVLGQHPVEPTQQRGLRRLGAPPGGGGQHPGGEVEVRDLAAGVHAGVRAAGAGDGYGRLSQDLGERCLESLLDGPQRRLDRPAVEVGAVVGEVEADAHDTQSYGAAP